MEKGDLVRNIGEKMYPLFFNRNFGLATKGEIESILFNVYMNNKVKNGEDYSDRHLSRELGISEARVRNLKRTCYARYEDEINFPELLISLAKKDSDLMFFNISNSEQGVMCQITVTEIVYFDELCAQLTNSKIHFEKKTGSNYVELSMVDAIAFFDQDTVHNESEELYELVSEMRKMDFDDAKAEVIQGIIADSKFSNTIMAIGKLIKRNS